MSVLRRNGDRKHDRRPRQEAWSTFPSNCDGSASHGFGAIEAIDEHRLPPGARIPLQPKRDSEIITYVREGALSIEDALGRPGVIQAGEFQRMAARGRPHFALTNASHTDEARVFQIRLRHLDAPLAPNQEQRRFSAAERRGVLCVVASADGRRGSLRIHQDSQIYSSLLFTGQHVVHELGSGRNAWLHIVSGEATMGDLVLTTGDGVGVMTEPAVSFTATESTELLLLDVVAELPAAAS